MENFSDFEKQAAKEPDNTGNGLNILDISNVPWDHEPKWRVYPLVREAENKNPSVCLNVGGSFQMQMSGEEAVPEKNKVQYNPSVVSFKKDFAEMSKTGDELLPVVYWRTMEFKAKHPGECKVQVPTDHGPFTVDVRVVPATRNR